MQLASAAFSGFPLNGPKLGRSRESFSGNSISTFRHSYEIVHLLSHMRLKAANGISPAHNGRSNWPLKISKFVFDAIFQKHMKFPFESEAIKIRWNDDGKRCKPCVKSKSMGFEVENSELWRSDDVLIRVDSFYYCCCSWNTRRACVQKSSKQNHLRF